MIKKCQRKNISFSFPRESSCLRTMLEINTHCFYLWLNLNLPLPRSLPDHATNSSTSHFLMSRLGQTLPSNTNTIYDCLLANLLIKLVSYKKQVSNKTQILVSIPKNQSPQPSLVLWISTSFQFYFCDEVEWSNWLSKLRLIP